jgi:hypothetical protein
MGNAHLILWCMTFFGVLLRGSLGLLCSLFCYSAPPNACQTGRTPATLLLKKCRVESNSTVLLEQQNGCSRKNSFQRRHGVVGKLPAMPSIMKKRFTVSSTVVCLTHSLPSTSNRSTSASLTRNPSRRPWRALRQPPVRNRCHKSSHPVPLLLIPKLLQAIQRRLQSIRRRRSSQPHVLARWRWHAVWAFHVHEGTTRAAPRRPPVGRLEGIVVVDLPGGAVPWVLRV